MHMSLSKLWEMVKDREARPGVVHGVAKSQTQLRDWAELNSCPGIWAQAATDEEKGEKKLEKIQSWH